MSPTQENSLSNAVRKETDFRLVSMCNKAWQDAERRDRDLEYYDDQLNGRLWSRASASTQFAGGTQIDDPLTRDAHLTLQSTLYTANEKSPKVQVQAINPDNDADLAKEIEEYLTNLEGTSNLQIALNDVAYTTLRDPVGVMRVEWRDTLHTVPVTDYKDVETGDIITAEERLDDRVYEPVPGTKEVPIHSGNYFCTPDLADVYVYPGNAQSFDGPGVTVFERMLLTEDDLIDGIDDYGYEEGAVARLIDAGPTHTTDFRRYQARQDWYDGNPGSDLEWRDGFYEVYMSFGRLPKIRGGAIDVPKDQRTIDYMSMICPIHSIVFKCVPSPYRERPYIPFWIIKKPNRLQGIGVPQLLDGLQPEANANLQLQVLSANYRAAPCLVAPIEWLRKYSKYKVYPGAILPEDIPNELHALEWGGTEQNLIEIQSFIKNRADGLVSAPGNGELGDKVYRAAQVQNVVQAASTKFSLYLMNFQLGLIKMSQLAIINYMQFVKGIDITLGELKARFRFIPVATLQTATPEARLQLDQGKMQIMVQYFTLTTQFPQYAPQIWSMCAQILTDMGERDPKDKLGPEPQPPQQQMGMGGLPPNPQLAPAVLGQLGAHSPGIPGYGAAA